ncbi:MAG: hypothetical protein ACE5EX_04560, partial [Phycisphaerae bacterium]
VSPDLCVPPCTTDAECDDGLACTGVEVCVPQECIGGGTPGSPCTSDADCPGAGAFCGGLCRSMNSPCGTRAACFELPPAVGPICTLNGRCCGADPSGEFLVCDRPRPVQGHDWCSAAVINCPRPSPTCGDRCVDAGEECDHGNLATGDGCDANCLAEVCPTSTSSPPGALPITDGLFAFDTACGTLDGPDAIVTEFGGPVAFGANTWFAYTATCTGIMVASTCPTQSAINQNGNTGLDGLIALYHNPLDPTRCLCPPRFFPGLVRLEVAAADESFNGIFDAGSGFVAVTVFPGECWLVRVGPFASPFGDRGAVGRGLLDVRCEPGTCPVSTAPQADLIPDAAGNPVVSAKNRYLSFSAGDGNRLQAVRVTFVDLPPPFDALNGQKRWVGPPQAVSELPGRGFNDTPGQEATFYAATLQINPHFTNWSAFDVVHVFDAAIVPSVLATGGGAIAQPAVYHVQTIDGFFCRTSDEEDFSPPVAITMSAWGDVAGRPVGGQSTPPDLQVEVISDAVAVLDKFAGKASAPAKVRVDLEPAVPDGLINISDVVQTINAFRGQAFPFTPALSSFAPAAANKTR